MADKLLIIMVNTDPSRAQEVVPAFFQATVARALEYEVEILLTGRAGQLAQRGVAQALKATEFGAKTAYDFIKEAHEAGAKIKVCNVTAEAVGEDLIPEIDETVGAAYLIGEAMTDGTVSFTY